MNLSSKFYFVSIYLLASCYSIRAQVNSNLVFGIEQRIKLSYTEGSFVWEEEYVSPDFTDEGSSAISDYKGDLLLYTNGVALYDHYDRIVLDGLKTSVTVTQSTLLLHHPSKPRHFVLITNDYDALYYTEVVRTKGEHDWKVVRENAILYQGGEKRAIGEKLCAVPNKGSGIWLITHIAGTNNFVSILLDRDGVWESQICTTGPAHAQVRGYSIGNLIPSPDGRFLVACDFEGRAVYLYQFDALSGNVCYVNTLQWGRAYSACFSSDSEYIFIAPDENTSLPAELHYGRVDDFPNGLQTTDYFIPKGQKVINVMTYYDDMLLLHTYDTMYCVKDASTPSEMQIEPIWPMKDPVLNMPNMLFSVFSTDSSSSWQESLCDRSYERPRPDFPNFFSPNRDDFNRVFQMSNAGLFSDAELADFELKIYNRWGQLVHTSKDLEWDGYVGSRLAPVGTYFYVLQAVKEDVQGLSVRGSVQLMR